MRQIAQRPARYSQLQQFPWNCLLITRLLSKRIYVVFVAERAILLRKCSSKTGAVVITLFVIIRCSTRSLKVVSFPYIRG